VRTSRTERAEREPNGVKRAERGQALGFGVDER
jgi:hypothetical protein